VAKLMPGHKPTATAPPEPGAVLSSDVYARLREWLRRAGLLSADAELGGLRRLSGGTQNTLIGFECADTPYVLRLAGDGRHPGRPDIVRREIAVLTAMAGTDVPRPGMIAACADTDVLGAVFYVMSAVDGFNPGETVPALLRESPRCQRQIGLAIVEALVTLHQVDVRPLVDAGFRAADGWLERQPDRWARQLADYGALGSLRGGPAIAAWLRDRMPQRWSPGLIHGDFNLGNVLVAEDCSRVTAIVDWELATIGDPLLDLAQMLVTWPAETDASPYDRRDLPHLTTRAELLARYVQVAPRYPDHLEWYCVLACFRLGVILEGAQVRAARGEGPADIGRRLHRIATGLFGLAEQLMTGRSPLD
jgi:aminoglycoside phosphotransferase (APT) family kinase protein